MNVPRKPMPALFWKEWRALRHLRWACTSLGVLLPLFFMAGAALGRSGIAPFGRVSSWSVSLILNDVVPATFAFALWPFTALIVITQAFGGDRTTGTESFLLERPVTRRRIWAIRLAASAASVATVVAWTLAVWEIWALAADGAGPQGWKRPVWMFVFGGVILLLVTPCAALASSLLASPLLAILASALLASLPLILSFGLGGLFPYAGEPFIPIGAVVPWLLIPLYLVVSYIASATGEPAGRGRSARAAGGLALGMIVTLFVFVTSAQALLGREASRPTTYGYLVAGPQGDHAIVGSPYRGYWLVSTKTGQVLEHYPRPSREPVWSDDGSMFAIETCAGPLGSVGRCRVSFFDREGKPAAQPWYEPPDEEALHLSWGKGPLTVLVATATKGMALVVLDPERGPICRMAMSVGFVGWDYAGILWDGSPAIVKLIPPETPDEPKNPGSAPGKEATFGLFRFDPKSGTVDPHPLLLDLGFSWSVRGGGLSPSGRWYRLHAPKSAPRNEMNDEMIDLETGRSVRATRGGWPDDPIRWYLQPEGDGTSLVEEREERAPRTLRRWPHGWSLTLRPSPDRRYLLIRYWHAGLGPKPWLDARIEEWLYEPAAGSWTELPLPVMSNEPKEGERSVVLDPDGLSDSAYWRTWASPRTFALWGPDVLAFEDVDGIGKTRYVVGRP